MGAAFSGEHRDAAAAEHDHDSSADGTGSKVEAHHPTDPQDWIEKFNAHPNRLSGRHFRDAWFARNSRRRLADNRDCRRARGFTVCAARKNLA